MVDKIRQKASKMGPNSYSGLANIKQTDQTKWWTDFKARGQNISRQQESENIQMLCSATKSNFRRRDVVQKLN